jgi:hypothetical protein
MVNIKHKNKYFLWTVVLLLEHRDLKITTGRYQMGNFSFRRHNEQKKKILNINVIVIYRHWRIDNAFVYCSISLLLTSRNRLLPDRTVSWQNHEGISEPHKINPMLSLWSCPKLCLLCLYSLFSVSILWCASQMLWYVWPFVMKMKKKICTKCVGEQR